MTVTGFDAIKSQNNLNIRKGLTGGVFYAPFETDPITKETLFDAETGDLVLQPGYTDLGLLTTDGIGLSTKITASDISSWQSQDPTRTDRTASTTTLQVECQETKLATIALYTGADVSALEAAANGSFSIQPPANATTRYYRMLAVAVDSNEDGEIIIARFLPRCSVTDANDQKMANGDAAITWGVTVTAYTDNALGYSSDFLFGGAALVPLLSGMTVPRNITATTAVSANLVATTGKFYPGDEGKSVSGGTIPAGTTILTYTDATHVVMSAPATAVATGVAVVVA